MATPAEFARAIVAHGTTTIIADPHEIANVLGVDGIRFMIEASQQVPLDVRIMLPSCVPATPFEPSGATLDAQKMRALLDNEAVLGLGELMNYPGLIAGAEDVVEKMVLAATHDLPVDGHSPALTGANLQIYTGAGILTDHECTTPEELAEKIRLGMYVLLREGSATRNLVDLLPGLTAENCRRCLLCTDDREPADVLTRGHLDESLRLAVAHGVRPLDAVRMGTLNTSECYGLTDRGGIAPGRRADFFLVDNLHDFTVKRVYSQGVLVAENGQALWERPTVNCDAVKETVHLAPLTAQDFALPLSSTKARVIGVVPGNVLTTNLERDVALDSAGFFQNALNPSLVKLAVIERHKASGHIGLGLLEGYGLSHGAIATTIAHDSHNIVVAGCSDDDMLVAVQDLQNLGGGITIVSEGKIIEHLALPIAGLMSEEPLPRIAAQLGIMLEIAHKHFGIPTAVQPFMNLSFLSLPVIPELKLTSNGLFDVTRFDFVSPEIQ